MELRESARLSPPAGTGVVDAAIQLFTVLLPYQERDVQVAAIEARGIVVTATSDDPAFDFVSRFFAPPGRESPRIRSPDQPTPLLLLIGQVKPAKTNYLPSNALRESGIWTAC